MIFDPNKLPFWEIERGNGPCTKTIQLRRKEQEKRSNQFASPSAILPKVLSPGCSWTGKSGSINY